MRYAIAQAMGPPVAQVTLTCNRPRCGAQLDLPYDQPMAALNTLAWRQGWTIDPAIGPVCPAHPAKASALAATVTAPAPAAAVTRPEGIPRVLQPAPHRVQHADLRPRRPVDDRRRRPRPLAGPAPLTLAVIVPAHNEEEGLPATLESLLRQTVPADQIIVVDDGSTDRTSQVAAAYPGVTVLRPPANLGSKAKAQNYALPYCRTQLVLPVDADTVLADDYIERVKPAFTDTNVAVAAGAVRTRFQKTIWERGREMEYLFGFHWFRPVQHSVGAPTVCSGCCTVFDLAWLRAFGGFPERTMVEDIDATWSAQIQGRRALYVADAVAYAAEPTSLTYMRKQLWRWKSGWFQNIRLHYPTLLRRKRWLALWVGLSLGEIAVSPIALTLPALWLLAGHSATNVAGWWAISEGLMLAPPLTYAVFKRRLNPLRVLLYYPSFYVLKWLNFYYDMKAGVVELMLVPLGLAQGLKVYEKGRAHTPGASPVQAGVS